MITLYGFGRIFPEGQGETKDLRAQWALEETGLPYRVHALDHSAGDLHSEAYGRISPFRQVPVIDGMPPHKISTMAFAKVYPLYVQKAERKGRTKEEVDQVIGWLTGYDAAGLQRQIESGSDFQTFFAQAPAIHPNSALIKGVVCGIRVEEIEDPLMQKIRQLDKLIDEVAKGKAMDRILRR